VSELMLPTTGRIKLHAISCLLTFMLSLFCHMSAAEVYIYQGPNGERLISDRPPVERQDYRLVAKRDSFNNAGHILADRPIIAVGPTEFRQHITSASNQYNVDPALIEAVIQVESGFDPNAVSKKGATGLMQLMPMTAKDYRVVDRFNPRQNIYGGVQHLSKLMTRFGGELPLVLAAYNAGAGAVESHDGIPPYPETKRYVKKVMTSYNSFKQSRYGTMGY
jgi:soluble lytic murein transglycosylase-like protein